MKASTYIGSMTVILFLCFLWPNAPFAGNRLNIGALPARTGAVLVKINPMLQKKDYPGALKILLEFQARGGPPADSDRPDPKGFHHPEIYFTMGNCYLMQKQYEAASKAYRQALKRDAAHTPAWLNLAKAFYEMNQYTKAGRCFSRGYESDNKKNPDYLYFSAAAFLMAGEHLTSIKNFEKLFTAHPTSVKPDWKEHFIHALLAQGLASRALPHIQELTELYSGSKQIQWQEILLYQYLKLDMQTEALKLVLDLTRRTPTIAKWWKALCHVQLNQGYHEEALAALTVYSFLLPLSMEEKKLMADLSLQVGIPVTCAPIYENYLKEKPDRKVLQNLVLAYRQLGRPLKALERMEDFGVDLKHIDLMLLKGELLYTLKKYKQAALIYRRAAGLKGRYAGRAWLMAGYASWHANNIAASRDAFVQAIRFKNEKKKAKEALKQLAYFSKKNDPNKFLTVKRKIN